LHEISPCCRAMSRLILAQAGGARNDSEDDRGTG
jgi:hypothetical protein